jgi:hypothetical protein
MDTLRQWLFLLACIPIFGGPMITMALSPKPSGFVEHAKGIGRLLMVGGSGFGALAVLFRGMTPTWSCTAIALGVAIHIALHAREQHLRALASEGVASLGAYLAHRALLAWRALITKFSAHKKRKEHA